MVLPITSYGNPVLRKKCPQVDNNIDLTNLIEDMFETMYHAKGVGLAAPQIGMSIRIFIVDITTLCLQEKKYEHLKGFREVFINPKMIGEKGEYWNFKESCLSVPITHEDVSRREEVEIEYYDENWSRKIKKFDSIIARVIQHEYDHIEGVLFIDRISALRRKLIKKQLKNIQLGKIEIGYSMNFPKNPKKMVRN